ncbi:MAG: exopolysaccharide biosynthesis protein [Alphaproteobacteria bacterium]|nr:exopolysaccharide biosynthesis protein [Alphaproteobacteria bacterium]
MAQSAPERLSLGAIAETLGDRSFGIVVLCLALPNGLPGPYVPGFSALFAVPIIWMAIDMARGRLRPRLPGMLRRVSFRRRRFVRFVDSAAPWLARIERRLAPHPSWFTRAPGLRCLGLVLVLFGIVLALPVPLGNVPIALGISILAVGLIEEDSRALVLGLVVGTLGCLWILVLVTLGVEAFARFRGYFW